MCLLTPNCLAISWAVYPEGMAHLELVKVKRVSSFRKMSIGTWRDAYDPSVYGTLKLRMDAAMDYLQRFREATGIRLTVSHLMAFAMARALERMPDANAILRWHRIYRRKKISVFFQVAMEDEDGTMDLTGATLHECDQMSLKEIAQTFERKVDRARKKEDKEVQRTRGGFRFVPFWMMGWVLRMISFIQYTLNIALPGTPKDMFGSVMITNVGSLGLDTAYVPLVPFSRVPMLLAVGAVHEEAVVEDGKVVPGKVMRINATFDHRFIDGVHAAIMSKTIRECFSNPDESFGEIQPSAEV